MNLAERLKGFTKAILEICPGRPPLTREQQKDIWQRSRQPAVHVLLWEIHRLRALVLRANDFVRQAKYHGLYRHMDTTSQTLFRGLQDALNQEPVVEEDEARRMDSER